MDGLEGFYHQFQILCHAHDMLVVLLHYPWACIHRVHMRKNEVDRIGVLAQSLFALQSDAVRRFLPRHAACELHDVDRMGTHCFDTDYTLDMAQHVQQSVLQLAASHKVHLQAFFHCNKIYIWFGL